MFLAIIVWLSIGFYLRLSCLLGSLRPCLTCPILHTMGLKWTHTQKFFKNSPINMVSIWYSRALNVLHDIPC